MKEKIMCVVNVYDLQLGTDRKPVLVKIKEVEVMSGSDVITEPRDIYNILTLTFNADTKAEEYMYLICCDGAGRIIGLFEVSHGTVGTTLTNVQGILTRVLLLNSHHVFIAHNHPSGDCERLSNQDAVSYCVIRDACDLIRVTVEDNVIIGSEGRYMSFCEKGLLEIDVTEYSEIGVLQ